MNLDKFELTSEQINSFHQDGYLIVRNWCESESLKKLQKQALEELECDIGPLELEAQLGYPGAPEDLVSLGGETPRRLLGAYQRTLLWQNFATSGKMKACLSQLFKRPSIYLSQVHHNCLMTKFPDYSSDTGWHQDIRYWSFEKPELISSWLALGHETPNNGGLMVIPGTHRVVLSQEQFDEQQFFCSDLALNQEVLQQAKPVELEPGDLLLFHCGLLHSASRNRTKEVKLSLVFTYHSDENVPVANSRSSSLPEVLL